MKEFEITCEMRFSCRVIIEAETKDDALRTLRKGGGWIRPAQIDVDKSSAELEDVDDCFERD